MVEDDEYNPPGTRPTLRVMITSDNVWERMLARQALMQLGVPDHERDEMIEVMLKSSAEPERLEGATLLAETGRSEQAILVLREIATRGSKEHRSRAEDLLRAIRAQLEDDTTQSKLNRP